MKIKLCDSSLLKLHGIANILKYLTLLRKNMISISLLITQYVDIHVRLNVRYL